MTKKQLGKIPVIDLFAGPGGLGEGFSAVTKNNGQQVFDIALSVENNPMACQTLLLRKFFRCFSKDKIPQEYYNYIKGKITKESLYALYPNEYNKAQKEILQVTLGNTSNEELDAIIKSKIGDNKNWLLIGGPPCQAYSLVGRSVIKKIKKDNFEKDPRHLLYREYLRIISVHKPAVFVMENVVGILSSKLNGELIFPKILNDLSIKDKKNKATYKLYSFVSKNNEPKDFVVEAEQYGIPQKRHRVLILGIRSDINVEPSVLEKRSKKITVGDVISDLPKLRSGLSKDTDNYKTWKQILLRQRFAPNELLNDIKNTQKQEIGSAYIKRNSDDIIAELKSWYYDSNLDGVSDHVSRKHIAADIIRYFFASIFAQKNKISPRLKDFPKNLLPKHKNVQNAILSNSVFNDRFKVQLKDEPSSTITSHISKDGHYFIHYDPTQARSLTPREAARLQTFPDNFKFEGNKTEQYHQIGNAVPPLLAKQLGEIVWDIFKKI